MSARGVFRAFCLMAMMLCGAISATPQSRDAQRPEATATAAPEDEVSKVLTELVNGPDARDIPWKVVMAHPQLMYLQYTLVQVQVRVPSDYAGRAGGELVVGLKIKDSNGHWLPGFDRAEIQLHPELLAIKEISATLAFYVRPGDYELVIAAYVTTTKAASVTHQKLQIPTVNRDPLPTLDQHLFPATFPTTYPTLAELGAEIGSELFEVRPYASPIEVKTPQPVRIDVVTSVSRNLQEPPSPLTRPTTPGPRGVIPRRNRPNAETAYRTELGRLLQVAYVLSQVRPVGGCTTLTIIDPLKRKVLLQPQQVSSLKWNTVASSISAGDQLTVDARDLADKSGAAVFAQKFFEDLTTSGAKCSDSVSSKRRYVVLIDSPIEFPKYHDEHISAAAAEGVAVYRFAQETATTDELKKVLKPAKVHELPIDDAGDFRKSLARFIADLQAGK